MIHWWAQLRVDTCLEKFIVGGGGGGGVGGGGGKGV